MAEGHERAKNQDRFHTYIYKVLKLLHPDLAISTIAINIIDNLAKYTLRRLDEQAKIVFDLKKVKTLDSSHIEEAVSLVLPGALYKHGVGEGDKALVRYNNNKDLPIRSLTAKAGLVFPVTRVKKLLKLHTNIRRIDISAAIYLAAVCEYMTAEVLEVAGNAANELNDKRILPPHLAIEIGIDDELSQFFQHVLIHRKESVIPRINRALIDGVAGPSRIKSDGASVQFKDTTPSVNNAMNIMDDRKEEHNSLDDGH